MSDEPTKIIDVDGHPVEVDAAVYDADPAACEQGVREKRQEVVGDLTGLYAPAPDYDEIVATVGAGD